MSDQKDQLDKLFVGKNPIAGTSSHFFFFIEEDKGLMIFIEENFDDILFGHGGKLFEDDFLEGKEELKRVF